MLAWHRIAYHRDESLQRCDIAVLNMACAADLPGAEGMDVPFCLQKLDEWADQVRNYTDKHLHQFHRCPGNYENSEAYFRVLCMITALQRECGARYNPAKIALDTPLEPADSFIFGILQGRGGTCASMPVVYCAVGRRLGYPLKLVAARGKAFGHFFARWDEPGRERFNIEASGQGLSCLPDEYYRTGLYAITADDERQCQLLQSMTPRQEFAHFLVEAYHCWQDASNDKVAVEAVAWATALAPDDVGLEHTLKHALDQRSARLEAMKPSGFPQLDIVSARRRYPSSLRAKHEREILGLEAIENMLTNPEQDRQWWKPMREGKTLSRRPVQAVATFDMYKCEIALRIAKNRDTNGACVPC